MSINIYMYVCNKVYAYVCVYVLYLCICVGMCKYKGVYNLYHIQIFILTTAVAAYLFIVDKVQSFINYSIYAELTILYHCLRFEDFVPLDHLYSSWQNIPRLRLRPM